MRLLIIGMDNEIVVWVNNGILFRYKENSIIKFLDKRICL